MALIPMITKKVSGGGGTPTFTWKQSQILALQPQANVSIVSDQVDSSIYYIITIWYQNKTDQSNRVTVLQMGNGTFVYNYTPQGIIEMASLYLYQNNGTIYLMNPTSYTYNVKVTITKMVIS